MQRLVIIDGHAILHRAYHALPPLTTSTGEQVNAVFGFISMLLRVISDLKPDYLAVAFDRPKPTFRKQLYVGYQAKRPKMDSELVPQIEIVHKVLNEMGIQIFEMDGYEADDVIGTIAERIKNHELRIKNNGFDTIVVTGDRDLLQLIDDKTKIYMPVKGLSESKLYGEKEVEEKFGIKPEQIVDYKALVGDASDNYPGVPGIGPKAASSLLSCFSTLEELYEHLGNVKSENIRKKLAENAESAGMAKKLATIIRDVPIVIDLEKCRLSDFDRPNVHKTFEDLEFRSLIPRLSGNNRKQIKDNIQQITDNKKKTVQQTTLF
jgi:DNA polymerase-1